MKKTAVIMGMPVTVQVAGDREQGTVDRIQNSEENIEKIFSFLRKIDERFSTYKKDSEISKINRGEISVENSSPEMKRIFQLAEQTRKETQGFFDIHIDGQIDPSGIVKGYAITEAAERLEKMGYKNFYLEIAGDIELRGLNNGRKWRVGIENPFNRSEIIKVLEFIDCGIATSGTYIRGNHIIDPVHKRLADDIASVTVIGPTAYDADRMATAAFAMGEDGIVFIENLSGYEGYLVTKHHEAIMTTGFPAFILQTSQNVPEVIGLQNI